VFTDAIAGAAHGMEQRLRESVIDLASQAADVCLHNSRLRIEVELPHVLQKHGAGHDTPSVAHQVLQKLEFLRLQLNSLTAPCHASLQEIEFQIGDLEEGWNFSQRSAARQCIHPSIELGERNRLDGEIISARRETLDTIIDAAKRGKKQYRGLHASAAN